MKPFYTKATTHFDNSFTIRYDERDHFYPHWHYHDEYELVYVHTSKGIRYVGDSISPYSPGDLVLLGSKLPHIWINKISEQDDIPEKASATIIHFQSRFVQNGFFELPMMKKMKNLFDRSTKGIRFIDFPNIDIFLNNIHDTAASKRIISVLELLAELSSHTKQEYLSSTGYHQVVSAQHNDRLSKIHNYLAVHFKEKIQLKTLAGLANMTLPAFCTYFKNKTTKTVFTYINDLRVGYSSKLLLETGLTIDQIAYQSGYNNTTFYNRKFKAKMGVTPKEYRKKYRPSHLPL